MSLDFSISAPRVVEVYTGNITHNLERMADAAGLYQVLWRPEEIGVKLGAEAVPLLRAGIFWLENHEEEARHLNPSNGWGSYDGLLGFARQTLKACEEYPDGEISVSR